MCGIFASLDFPLDEDEAPWSMLAHRGPDDEGQHRDPSGRCVLGHRRLAVVDVDGGRQPCFNEDGRICVVFNGEIYGFERLRERLEEEGHRFRSRCDTEVLVHGWEQWGVELCDHIDGEFAFAIWDGTISKLFFARDRFGAKPLYYARAGNGLILASEAKALFACRSFQAELELTRITHFLAFGFIPAPDTIWKNVHKLDAGHWGLFDGDSLIQKAYWNPTVGSDREEHLHEDLVRETRHLLRKAVSERLVADVPIGIFLSGGVDSSGVAAAATRAATGVRTFNASFDEPSWDESSWAKTVAAHLKTRHSTLEVKARGLDLLPLIVWHFDEPFGDSSAIPTYLVSKLAREHVTAVLGGDAGDELFGGYIYYAFEREVQAASRCPAPLRAIARSFWSLLTSVSGGRIGRFKHMRDRLADSLRSLSERRFLWGNLHPTSRLRRILRSEIFRDDYLDAPLSILSACDQQDTVGALMHLDRCFGLPNDMLTKVDRMSMANGLEVRVPFLDLELSELALRTPPKHHVRRGRLKCLLKDAVAPWLPPGVTERKKMGFCAPTHAWFRSPTGDPLDDYLLGRKSHLPTVVEPDEVRSLIRSHREGKEELGEQIWHFAVLETFLRTWDESRLRRPLEDSPWKDTRFS